MAKTTTTGWLRYNTAVPYSGQSRTTLWRAVRDGKLKAHKIGRAVLFQRADIDAWLRSESHPSQ